MKYRVTGTIEVDDGLLAVLAAVGDPHNEEGLAVLIDVLLVNETGGLICDSDVQLKEIEFGMAERQEAFKAKVKEAIREEIRHPAARCIDPLTGEIIATKLGEWAASEFDYCEDPNNCDGSCDGCEYAFALAAEVVVG